MYSVLLRFYIRILIFIFFAALSAFRVVLKNLLFVSFFCEQILVNTDYYYPDIKRQILFDKLNQLLLYPIEEQHAKSKTLQKKLLAKPKCILYFLEQPNVPPDNYGSERAIRNIKVKQKISVHPIAIGFKSLENTNIFTTLRLVIDPTIKNGNNVV